MVFQDPRKKLKAFIWKKVSEIFPKNEANAWYDYVLDELVVYDNPSYEEAIEVLRKAVRKAKGKN